MVFLSEFLKDGVCLGMRMSTILFKKKEMTHFGVVNLSQIGLIFSLGAAT